MRYLYFLLLLSFPLQSYAQGGTYWYCGSVGGSSRSSPEAVCTTGPIPASFKFYNGGVCTQENGTGAWCSVLPASCPSGFWFDPDTGQCEIQEECDNPDPVTLACPPVLPNCDIFTVTPENAVKDVVYLESGNAAIQSFCSPFYSEDDSQCQNVIGTINGHEYCGDDKDECEAVNGTYGFFGLGDDISSAICIPSNFTDDLPECDSTGAVILVKNAEGEGSYICDAPVKPPGTEGVEVPGTEPPTVEPPETCIGSDCLPPPPEPPEVCTGACDPNDPSTFPEKESEVSGGGNCAQAPTCSGDGIQCSINFQLWKTRCDNEKKDDNLLVEIKSDPGAIFGAAIDTLGTDFWVDIATAGDGIDGDSVETAAQGMGTAITDYLPNSGGGCSANNTISFAQGTMILDCAKLQQFKDMIGWVLMFYTLFYIFNLATSPLAVK